MAYGAPRPYPNGAYILSLIGGIFIILAGLVYVAIAAVASSVYSSLGLGGIGAAAASILIVYAVVALILGFLVIYGAIQLKRRPEGARTWGVLILVFSLISIIGGGGFYIGLILGLIGGILAIVWRPPAPMMGQGPMGQPMWGAPPPMAPPPGAAPAAGGAGQRFCASCGSPNAAGTQFCAKCGAAMPP